METYEVPQKFQYQPTTSYYEYVDRVEEQLWRRDESDEDHMHILKELLKEVDHKGHEMCKKLVSSRLVRKRVHDLCGKPGSDMLEKIARKLNNGDENEDELGVFERGVGGDILEEVRVDRFKVKTMNTIGVGVVKEEVQEVHDLVMGFANFL